MAKTMIFRFGKPISMKKGDTFTFDANMTPGLDGIEVQNARIEREDGTHEYVNLIPEKASSPPEKLVFPDWGAIEKIVQEYIAFVWSPDYHDDSDFKHYIFETAIRAIYGEGIWDKINAETRSK